MPPLRPRVRGLSKPEVQDPDDEFVGRMADIAVTLARRNNSVASVVQSLRNEGCPAVLAKTIAEHIVGARKVAIRQQAQDLLLTSVPAFVAGIGITYWSMEALGGGRIIVASGLILYGLVNSVRAMYFWYSGGESL
jgi:hypothetical protein